MPATLDTPPRWPDVPACHGWLSLDPRGNWRLQDEPISPPGLIAFLNANYTTDAGGCWLVNNGPQRVYVRLGSAPWVLRLQPDGSFVTHTGRSVALRGPIWLDGDSRVFMDTDAGPAALDDRDLAMLFAEVCNASGDLANEADLSALMQSEPGTHLHWHGTQVMMLGNEAPAERLGFNPDPKPEDTPLA